MLPETAFCKSVLYKDASKVECHFRYDAKLECHSGCFASMTSQGSWNRYKFSRCDIEGDHRHLRERLHGVQLRGDDARRDGSWLEVRTQGRSTWSWRCAVASWSKVHLITSLLFSYSTPHISSSRSGKTIDMTMVIYDVSNTYLEAIVTPIEGFGKLHPQRHAKALVTDDMCDA
ncbi:hypothetical protein L2E82_50204 [Cichorium intybus]|nr:hypothetical protein L2E82_50204 [Cichorium intybus]